MLLILACWVILIGCSLPTGAALLRLLQAGNGAIVDRIILAIWCGLLLLASMSLGLSVLLPLSPGLGAGLGALAAGAALAWRPVRADLREMALHSRPRHWSAAIVLGAGVAFSASGVVEAYDTGLYHYQMVRWLGEFGTVPGLALVHIRLGQSSSWFALAAPFDFGALRGRTVAILDSLALYLCLLHLASAVRRVLAGSARTSDWFLAGGYPLIVAASFAWSLQASLSPDVPAWILTLLAGWLLLSDLGDRCASPALLFLSASAFSIKLSALPLLAMAAVLALATTWREAASRLRMALACLPTATVLLANSVSSGFPLFPNTGMELPVSWSIGSEAAQEYGTQIANYARWGEIAAPILPAQPWWRSAWFLQGDKLAAWAASLACLAGFAALRGWRLGRAGLRVLALALGGAAFLLATLPNPRFGIGYFALFPGLFFAALSRFARVKRLLSTLRRLPCDVPLALVTTAAWLLFLTGAERALRFEIAARAQGLASFHAPTGPWGGLLAPPALPQFENDLMVVRNRRFNTLATFATVHGEAHGIAYERPASGDQCWGAPIPCSPSDWPPGVARRDARAGLRAGFVRLKPERNGIK